jgi:hypothetical protein
MNIRREVFETNSSSSHSVVLRGDTDFAPVTATGDEVVIEPGEFGWGYERLEYWKDKASYAYTYAASNPAQMEVLRKVIADFVGVPVRFNVWRGEWAPTGYIDHQSADEGAVIFADGEASVKQCIFGPSYIIIDNDNH